ncbi:Disease resistance protein rga2, partial [Thalictrum thalictroides]
MRSLRHLDVGGCRRLSKMPIKMGEMIGLRTLSKFIVGEKKGEKINELNELKHLSGELELKGLELVKDSTEAKEADLASKPNLSSLRLLWGETFLQEDEKKKSERVLECLQPHVNLNQKLIISGYGGVVLPSWMSLLQNLREIYLTTCWDCETLPPLGQLPLLQVLEICYMTSLKCIGVEFYGEIGGHLKVFPSLEDLKLEGMHNLEKWEFPSSLLKDASFPCLRTLSLLGCRKLETPSILMPTSCCLRKLNSLTIG